MAIFQSDNIYLFFTCLFSFGAYTCHLQETKSIGADVNWGVRFDDITDVCVLQNLKMTFFILSFFLLYLLIFCILLFFFWLFQCQNFLMNLCKEVSLRLQGCGVQGRAITLKVYAKINFHLRFCL